MTQLYRKLRLAILLVACLSYVIQSPFAIAADTTDMCDPNNPERRAKQIFRGTNDILYFDNCVGTCTGSASATLLPGDNYAEKAYNYLISKGFTPEQAAGVVGNMIHESGVNPQRMQGTPLNQVTSADQVMAVNSSTGWGIVQWTPASKMIRPTKDANKDPNDLATQLDFLNNELNTNEKPAGDALRATKTVEEATAVFEYKYERHAADASASLRLAYAQAIYNKATKGEPYPPEVEAAIYKGDGTNASAPTATAPTSPSAPSGCGSAATDNGECKNPFRDLKDSAPMRYDGGLDYGGNNGEGPVYAACPAEIVNIWPTEATSGWPGIPGSYITYKITAGKAKDLFMYIAEDCTPTVKVGDKVTTDQPICNYKQASAYLEIGWSEGGNNSYVSWSDYPGAANSWASNSGLDVGHFLETLGVGKGIVQMGPSNVPPPADWPKW